MATKPRGFCISTIACAWVLVEVAQDGLTYSRVVAFLKVVLPLAALALLSTLFLFARNGTPTSTIPFAQVDLEKRARDQQITAPYIAGKNKRGDLIALTASTARPDPDNATRILVNKLDARIDLVGGQRVTFSSENGMVDSGDQLAMLAGGVLILTSTGYSARTQTLTTSMSELLAETDDRIEATGPLGDFTAGAMRLSPDPETGEPYLVFTNGVKLVYTPKG